MDRGPNPRLHLRPAAPTDIPAFADIVFAAFESPFARRCFPDIPSVRDWWIKANSEEIHDPNTLFLKVIEKDDASEDGPIVALAKWARPIEGKGVDPLPEWPEGADARLANDFFEKIRKCHEEIMGKRPHWYLKLLATHPSYQGQGAGSLLLSQVLRTADETQTDAYLEASPVGESLYRKFGFDSDRQVTVTLNLDDKEVPYANAIMVRKAGAGKAC